MLENRFKNKKKKEKFLHNVKHIVFPALRISHLGNYSLSLLKYLKNEIQSNKIILNISNLRTVQFYSVSRLCKNIPLVVQNHGEATVIYKLKVKKGLKKLFYYFLRPIEIKSFKNVDHLFVLDERLMKYLPETLSKNKVSVQILGVHTEMFKAIKKQKAKEILNLNIEKNI